MPSGGCEVVVDPVSWSKLAGANRGLGPITITVRGTTDGTCASSSTNQIHLSFAEEDLLGTYYYWKSTVSPNGTGGQIWKKTFGDLNMQEVDVTTPAIPAATCNGCHSLSRDGTRMVVYSDDDDSDDEYSDVAGSYLDMTTNPATVFPGGVTGIRQGGQPPGFSTIDPAVTAATTPTAQGFYITSNGMPCVGAGGGGFLGGGGCGTSNGYPAAVPTNGWSIWNGTNGAFVGSATIGAAATRPTMPDWSPDGKSIVYVVPAGGFDTWRTDDAHIYGGSLYTVPYAGNGTFGAPAVFLQSNGENNYYPSYSPDVPMSFIIFNRVDNMGKGATCAGGFCPDDSFSNPAARLLLMGAAAANATPTDLEKANGSPITAKVPWSNSYPRWAPFVQTYRGNKLLWFTFSSTRDYGVRVLNHKKRHVPVLPVGRRRDAGNAPRRHVRAPVPGAPALDGATILLRSAREQGSIGRRLLDSVPGHHDAQPHGAVDAAASRCSACRRWSSVTARSPAEGSLPSVTSSRGTSSLPMRRSSERSTSMIRRPCQQPRKRSRSSGKRTVIIPDTTVPGGWLCNHSCNPNAAIFSGGDGRIQCSRPISPSEEVTIFYGWVSHNEPRRDPCHCGSPQCRGFINFDLGDEDAIRAQIVDGNRVELDDVLRARLAEYGRFLHSIGQEQVNEVIANTLVRLKVRKSGSVICAF